MVKEDLSNKVYLQRILFSFVFSLQLIFCSKKESGSLSDRDSIIIFIKFFQNKQKIFQKHSFKKIIISSDPTSDKELRIIYMNGDLNWFNWLEGKKEILIVTLKVKTTWTGFEVVMYYGVAPILECNQKINKFFKLSFQYSAKNPTKNHTISHRKEPIFTQKATFNTCISLSLRILDLLNWVILLFLKGAPIKIITKILYNNQKPDNNQNQIITKMLPKSPQSLLCPKSPMSFKIKKKNFFTLKKILNEYLLKSNNIKQNQITLKNKQH
ncbi:hypothetical protein ABPG74_008403 [Tetrahymena malaccensis]